MVQLLLWMVSLSVVAAATAIEVGNDEFNQPQGSGYLRGGRRQLAGYETMTLSDFGDLDNAEVGAAAGILITLLVICCLLCMCCGGGSRCSLWDCLALVCIWEMCCGGGNPSDFVSM